MLTVKTTIKDVAKQSGVSISTVSAVLNATGWVPEDTKDRVERAINDLGYRPNRIAQSLKKRRSNAYGIIVSDLLNPYFTEIVSALQLRLLEGDKYSFIFNSDRRSDLADKSFEFILDRQLDGIVLISDSVSEKIVRKYSKKYPEVPIVAIERDYDIDSVYTLLVDSEKAAFEATTYLVNLGYKRIAMITGPSVGVGSSSYGRLQRTEGYTRALKTAKLPVSMDLIVEGTFRMESGEAAMHKLLCLPKRPDAVFAANDLMALGAMKALKQVHLRIPDDVALMGYDDIALASMVSPALTTLAMPKKELGEKAAEILLKLAAEDIVPHDSSEKRLKFFNASLVPRDSV
jgi:LacI family transcriptional regulator